MKCRYNRKVNVVSAKKRASYGMTALFIVIIASFIVQAVIVNSSSEKSIEYRNLLLKKREIEDRRNNLLTTYYSLGSLDSIYKRALEKGMVSASISYYAEPSLASNTISR